MIAGVLVDLLVAAAASLAKGAAGEFGKGAGKGVYEALRARLSSVNRVEGVETIQASEPAAVEKNRIIASVESSGALNDPETLRLMEELRQALEASDTARAHAIEGGSYTAAGNIIARHVEGLRDVTMNAQGDIDLSGAQSPGKR